MIPVFSATNTRPLGAISTSCGRVSPEIAVVCSNPAGSATAPAPGVNRTKRQAIVVANASEELAMLTPRAGLHRVGSRHAAGVMEGLDLLGLTHPVAVPVPVAVAA